MTFQKHNSDFVENSQFNATNRVKRLKTRNSNFKITKFQVFHGIILFLLTFLYLRNSVNIFFNPFFYFILLLKFILFFFSIFIFTNSFLLILKLKSKVFVYFVIIFSLLILSDILIYISFNLLNSQNPILIEFSLIFFNIGYVLLVFIPIILIFIFSSYIKTQTSIKMTIPPIMYLSINFFLIPEEELVKIGSFILSDTNDYIYYFYLDSPGEILTLATLFIFLYVLFFTFFALKKSSLNKKSHKMKNFKVSLIYLIFFIPILKIITLKLTTDFEENLLGFFFENIVFIGFLNLGIIFLLYQLNSVPNFTFLFPQPIREMIIVNEDGKLIYQRIFESNFDSKDIGNDAILIAGGLASVLSILKESYSLNEIKYILFENKLLLIKYINNLGFLLITNQTSILLNKTFEIFCKECSLLIFNGFKNQNIKFLTEKQHILINKSIEFHFDQ